MKLRVLAAMLSLSGCASLDVRVDVLDPAYVRQATQETALQQDALRLLQNDTSQEDALKQELRDSFLNVKNKILRQLDDVAEKQSNKQELQANTETSRNNNSEFFKKEASFSKSLATANAEAKKALSKDYPDINGYTNASFLPALKGETRAYLLARQSQMRNYESVVEEQILNLKNYASALVANRIIPADASPNTRSLINADNVYRNATNAAISADVDSANRQVANAANRTILGGGLTLANNTAAYIATSSDAQSRWALMYNRAYGHGFFGGTDIAIKMNDTADFTVKGLVFDGRATANMVSKVASRAVTLIAAAYGAPFATKAEQGTAPASVRFDSTASIDASVATLAEADAKNAAWRTTLFRIADSITSNVDKNDHITDAGRTVTRATYDSRSASWVTATPK